MKYAEYLDKVRACWLGKNIGGTLGAPFEAYRCAMDLEYYTHDITKGAIPNDDLDLQLVWLNAAEKYKTAADSEILSSFWVMDVTAYWSEYGAGMNNLDFGILPPGSGNYQNPFKESCGAFIRSEIWACLAPGHPEIAVKYASIPSRVTPGQMTSTRQGIFVSSSPKVISRGSSGFSPGT